jgi:hypothetical protein
MKYGLYWSDTNPDLLLKSEIKRNIILKLSSYRESLSTLERPVG